MHFVVFVCIFCIRNIASTVSSSPKSSFVSLNYPLNNKTLFWPGGKKLELIKEEYHNPWYARNTLCMSEHGGTHLDAPYHFNQHSWKVGDIPFDRLIAPGIVIDVSAKVAKNSNYALSTKDILEWEYQHGEIPNNSIILIRSGWNKWWTNEMAYYGADEDEVKHFPGISTEAATWLIKNRYPFGIGVDTASVDVGISKDFQTHRITAAANIYLLENIANMDTLPFKDFLLFVFPINITEGRREKILKKYPEIKKLFGPDPLFKWEVTACVITQIIMCFIIKDSSWTVIFLVAYCFGGVINHSLTLAIHDISHNMAYGYAYPVANRLFGMWANLPIGVPMSVAFKKYHVEHHRNQGVDLLDTDVPTLVEAKLFCTTLGKVFWLILQPLFYVIRPVMTYPLPVSKLEMLNIVVQVIFDGIIWALCGYRSVVYLIFGTIVTMGLHPMAAHFISEHYMFEKGFETYSYYGPFNAITFNVGYHSEHHDFPAVPHSKLPEVRRIASEFYDSIPYHTSYLKVLYDFIFDPAIGPYTRIKRKQYGLD